MKETELFRALDASVTGCRPSDHWKNHMVRQIVKGEEMKKRTKLSFSIIIAVSILLISAAALAVNALVQGIHEYYTKVAEMEKNGALSRWNLEDKTAFVNAMLDCDMEMDPELYRTMNDPALPDDQREAAADRIIDHTYGELIRNQLGYYIVEPEDSLGIAPDPIIVFEERYLAEHPEGIETHDQFREYTDALGYYLRDEYLPVYDETEETQERPAEPAEINREYAVQCLRGYMTEVLCWDPEAVAEMTPAAEWDPEYRIWTVTGEVSRESMEKATDPKRGLKPCLEGFGVEETENGYQATVLVDSRGNMSMDTPDKQEFAAQHPDEIAAIATISVRRATEIAEQAIRDRFGLSKGEVREFFSSVTQLGTDEDHNLICRIDFCNHYAVDVDRIYGTVVNLGTGTVESAFSYSMEEGTAWSLLKYAAEREPKEGRYVYWSPESKRELADRIRNCGILPDHEYWKNVNPTEEQTDAFVAEAFGRKGYASAVNVMGMAETLLGKAEAWSRETISRMEYLADKYAVRTEAIDPETLDSAEEISADEAGRMVRAAVCRTWEMPETAMDSWDTVVQLVQTGSERGSIAFYRVFLTRPDSETGQNTFGGIDNMNYRITLDGEILDSSANPQWLSPEEDARRWK